MRARGNYLLTTTAIAGFKGINRRINQMKKNLKKLLLMILLMATLAACTNKSEDTPNPSAPENGAASNDQSSNEPASSEAPQKPDFAGKTKRPCGRHDKPNQETCLIRSTFYIIISHYMVLGYYFPS